MKHCDVLVVGGGPGGSTCARALVRAGRRVVVADKARFPRDKVCAGWITPAVVAELDLDLEDYRQGRTLDPITAFRIGRMGDRTHLHAYDRPVSYGIRRCELDHYLLARSGAELVLGTRLDAFERHGCRERRAGRWLAGDIEAEVLVGAGGHFCPVARAMTGAKDRAVVAAEEAEFSIAEDDLGRCAVEAGVPELYFTRDLTGYGWAFRKGGVMNIGLGVRSDGDGGAGRGNGPLLRRRVCEFLDFLVREGRIGRAPAASMKGHAYLLQPDSARRRFGDGFVLVGDAAGLAYDRSGEGIRCAVESGLLAAQAIADAFARGDVADLSAYGAALDRRYGAPGRANDPVSAIPPSLRKPLAAALMASSWFSRRVLLERWFLHANEPALAAG